MKLMLLKGYIFHERLPWLKTFPKHVLQVYIECPLM